ncbi:hypothetical protein EVAR_82040_1 [Eumeta japonica]|uniref:Uncharacterized protein n=1 Tax=Eumeta variegata TaxID=151549 RepID=A0A4C1XKP0_EUMVA|nr:hypothetical protein EVAR_82040_1 [Eumeta japonica]
MNRKNIIFRFRRCRAKSSDHIAHSVPHREACGDGRRRGMESVAASLLNIGLRPGDASRLFRMLRNEHASHQRVHGHRYPWTLAIREELPMHCRSLGQKWDMDGAGVG